MQNIKKKVAILRDYLDQAISLAFFLGIASALWIGVFEGFKLQTVYITWFGWAVATTLILPALKSDEFTT